MPSCERDIMQLMVAATVAPQGIDRRGLRQLAERAAQDKEPEVRRFWTLSRITLTLAAIEDIREGNRYEALIETWYLPLVRYIRGRPAGRLVFRGKPAARIFRNFSERHGIRLRSSRAP